MQGLHAINMHPSLTEDLKSTVRSKEGNSQDIAVVVAAQQRLAHEQIGPAMNLRYEYKLPRGLGLAMKGSTEGTESASEIVLHTDGNSAGGSGSEDTLRPPSEIFFALQHQNLGLEVPACSGVSDWGSCSCMTVCCLGLLLSSISMLVAMAWRPRLFFNSKSNRGSALPLRSGTSLCWRG